MTDERAIIKLGLKMVQAVRTENRSKGQFGSLFFTPFITLGRLATASERTG